MDSKYVFQLRNNAKYFSGDDKLNTLIKAYEIAKKLCRDDFYDEWNQKAFGWILIDLCKYYIENKNLDQAQIHFQELENIYFEDEIIENQKSFLRPKINILYSEIQTAEELSKNGKHKEAYAIFQNLISQNKLTQLHHENYGWIIYRYIRAEENNLSSIEVRTFLRDYMNLKNERPSMLHSMILNFALNYSKTHTDFNFYKFFLLWNPQHLRNDDLHDGTNQNGDKITSLISRICKEFLNSNTEINLGEFLEKIPLSKGIILDFFRETIFWKIQNAHKENRWTDVWNLFENYSNGQYSQFGASKWHSEILNLAKRWMKENNEWRFFNFFKNWNPQNFREEDWQETKNGEYINKPLATESIKKAFEFLKTQKTEQDVLWLLNCYETATKRYPEDEFLLREKALLHFRNNEMENAIDIYKQLVLELSDKYYIWQEFSDCIKNDNFLKIGMLCKALYLEKNEDFLGDIHLNLAKILIDENLLENAFIELEIYKKHREIKGWKLSPFFNELYSKVNSVKCNLQNNRELYKKHIPIAENFAYADFDWTGLVLVDKWKDNKEKDRLTFSDGKNIEFAISKNRFEILKKVELGEIFKFKLHKQVITKEVEGKYSWSQKTFITEYKYIPLVVEKSNKNKWEIFDDTFAVVDYINNDKNIIHAITSEHKEVFFPQIKNELQINDFIKAKIYTKNVKNEKRIELKNIQKIQKNIALTDFKSQIAIVDNVNEEKQLFHFVISGKLQGIIKFSETSLRPKEGDFIKISYVLKTGKDKKIKLKILNIEETEEINPALRKQTEGRLQLKYKVDNYVFDRYEMLDEEDEENFTQKPDFAFINDYYVPKYLLEENNITDNCDVLATIIFTGDKWKTIEIKKYND